MAKTLVDICAYAGTGNVLKIQSLLHICSEHYEPPAADTKDDKKDKKKAAAAAAAAAAADDKADKKSDDKKEETADKAAEKGDVDLSMQQSVAVLGLALVAMGEDIGSEMLFR